MFVYFVFVNLNIYSRIGFPKKFQSCNLRDENMGFFQPRLKLQSTLPGWMFVVITSNNLSPTSKYPQKKTYIALNLVVSRIFRTK